jgi:hypothetical protein
MSSPTTPRKKAITLLVTLSLLPAALFADGPKDNIANQVRPIPPAGIPVPESEKQALEKSLEILANEIASLRVAASKKPLIDTLLPDVEIFHKAIDWALKYDEFYSPNEFKAALSLLEEGTSRARSLKEGKSPWTTQTGPVVRGYRSTIDNSVQPYGIVVPEGYSSGSPRGYRLDFWCHGRGEKLTELAFIEGRRKGGGEPNPAPAGALVLHPYGRYCNANKFAGEIDLFEALAHAKSQYHVDMDRLVMRGFSMGGAAAWHFTVHYPGMWAASNPGAGFSETPEFLRVFQDETLVPKWYEQALWNWYDCPGYVRNLTNCPTVAYSGEDDKQRQASERMAQAARENGFELTHIIGPKTGHKIHSDSKVDINQRLDRIVARGRDRFPSIIHFATYTLRYPTSHWVRIDEMEHHWQQAKVDARFERSPAQFVVSTENVAALTLQADAGDYPLDGISAVPVLIDGHALFAPAPESDRSWKAHFRKKDGAWFPVDSPVAVHLTKRPGLQGPIDDAFLSRFLVVRPTGKPLHPETDAWVRAELAHFSEHWRKQFRGDLQIKDDTAVTPQDIAESHLILWGDISSNALIARVAPQLPLRWNAQSLEIAGTKQNSNAHLPALIYPNPLEPSKYIVLNSGFTYREYDYLNNARQIPKLPDWAVLDVRVKPSSQAPCGIPAAGFFGERWQAVANQP